MLEEQNKLTAKNVEPIRRGMSGIGSDRVNSEVASTAITSQVYNEMQHVQRRPTINSTLVNSGNAAILGHANVNAQIEARQNADS